MLKTPFTARQARLPNGLRIVTLSLKHRPSFAVGVWVDIGGRDEDKRTSGTCHFIEHLAFKGTKLRSMREIKESVEGRGGALNAFTGEEFTCFHARVPQKIWRDTLGVLSDLVTGALFKREDVEKERKVVAEEIRMIQDQPGQLVEEALHELLWPNHALGRPLTGTLKSLADISREDLVAFRDRFYRPNLVTVVLAGDLSHDEAPRILKKLFKDKPPAKKPFSRAPAPGTPRFRLLTKKIEQSHMALAVPGLAAGDPDEYAAIILNIILGGNMSSRLFHEVREKRALAYDVGSGAKRFRDTGAFWIEAGTEPGKTLEAAKAILHECLRLKREAPSASEIKRAKEFFLGQFHMGLDNPMDLMLWAGEEMLLHDRLPNLSEIEKGIARVRAGDLKKLGRRIFSGPLYSAIVSPLGPKDSGRLSRALVLC